MIPCDYKGPLANGKDLSWDDFYVQVEATLKALLATDKSVIMMTPTIASPTTSKIVNDFMSRYFLTLNMLFTIQSNLMQL